MRRQRRAHAPTHRDANCRRRGTFPPPAAEQALRLYVEATNSAVLLGHCGPPFGAGWRYFNVSGGGDRYLVMLGLNGAGLPTWTIELVSINGVFGVGQVTENQGRE